MTGAVQSEAAIRSQRRGAGWNIALFALMCAIWGLTWIAIKVGVDALPPLFFAAARFLAAGMLLMTVAWLAGYPLSVGRRVPRLVITALLSNTACYGFAFWGMRYVPSGFAAVLNLSLIPVGIFTIGIAAGQERFSWIRLGAVALGVVGLVVMFHGRSAIDPSMEALVGAAAIFVGTLAFCLGSVFTRPLARDLPPLVVAGWHTSIGGVGLALLSIAIERPAPALFAAFAEPSVFAGWAFLVLGGSIAAYTIYLKLLRDWGPTAAGGYAFVSPTIALAFGALVFGERYTATEVVGAAIMLAATLLMLRTTGR
jgi:drug/metabolite transporter (DMT)-like permease